MAGPRPRQLPERWRLWFGKLPTGGMVFLILSVALAPLAAIAFFASIQTTRTADAETRNRVQTALRESAASLNRLVQGDARALASVLAAFAQDPASPERCARAEGAFAQYVAQGGQFALFDGALRLRCGNGTPPTIDRLVTRPRIDATLLDDALELRVAGEMGAVAVLRIPAAVLAEASRPSGLTPPYGVRLLEGDNVLPIHALRPGDPFARIERQQRPIGVGALALELSLPTAAITSSVLVTMLLPFLMWLAAAGIAWLVVDALLIRPLQRLRRRVGAYQPGVALDLSGLGPVPAQEIRELGDTFHDIARTVQLHEADLAEGLVRQTRLTREVHHRVKNNLQVIASLINLHARGAISGEATQAYASIQRRVDALAAVHRHHFAELEENHGLDLRAVLGEVASNIRATAPNREAGFDIDMDLDSIPVSQDTAVATAFLLTELIELAIAVNPTTIVTLTAKPGPEEGRAALRVESPALIEGPALTGLLETRYGRVIQGLVRQLRSQLLHEPLLGAYEVSIAVLARSEPEKNA